MASSSKKSATKVNLLGKRKPEEDELETKPILKRHKEKETNSDEACLEVDVPKNTLFVANLSPQTEISDIISFFEDVAQVVNVRLIVDYEGKHVGYGFIEFASANEAIKALENKNGQYLNYCKIILDETQDHQEAAVPKKTLFVDHFSPETTEISHVIDFFKDVGQVVRVRLVVDRKCNLLGCGFVEFASAGEAKKALQKKNGEYLHGHKIVLDVANRGAAYLPPPKYCIDHKVWYEGNYLQRESLPIEEDGAAVEGPDEAPVYRFKLADVVLLVANLSGQTEISDIIHLFKDVGEVVGVRLIVNHEGKNVGYAFVEFASSNEAKKAMQEKNGVYLHDHKILLMKGFDQTFEFGEAVRNTRDKTLFVDNLSGQTEISDIIKFFKDVGEVVHVRLIVDQRGKHVGCGFVEFASADEATKALEKKKGEYLQNSEIILDVAIKGASYLQTPKYCIDHKVWYEDYLERLVIVEGLDETPDFFEEVAVRKKTVFVGKLPNNISISDIIQIFQGVGTVVRVRLIVDGWGEHVGCCFVELATAKEAMKAVQMKCGQKFFLRVADIDRPYPFRPKYSIVDLAQKLWDEDYLLRKSICRNKNNPYGKRSRRLKLRKQFSGKKTTFSEEDYIL